MSMAAAHQAPRRRVLVTALVALCSILLTGCLHGDVDVTVNADGSGKIVVEVFPTRRVQEALRSFDVDIESLVEGSFEQVDGSEFDEISDGDRKGYRLVVPFDDYRDVERVLVDGGSLAGQQVKLFSSLRITELPDDAGWQLDAEILPLGQAIANSDTGMIPESMRDVLDRAGMGDTDTDADLDLSISLPGEVVASNADSISGGTATWRLDEPDAPATLQMRTEPKEFPTQVQLIVGGAVLAVVLGLALFVFGATRRHRTTKQPRRRRARGGAGVAPDADWSVPPTGTRPSPQSDRPEQLPPLAPPAPAPAPAGPAPTAPAPAGSEGWQRPAGAPPETPPPLTPPAPPVPDAPPVPAAPSAPTAPAAAPAPAAPPAPAAAPAPTAPAVAPAPAAPPADPGWYPDPEDPSHHRWWSGMEWTEHRS